MNPLELATIPDLVNELKRRSRAGVINMCGIPARNPGDHSSIVLWGNYHEGLGLARDLLLTVEDQRMHLDEDPDGLSETGQ